MRYINEIKEGESVVEHYFCKQRQQMKSKAGKNYISLKLQDKTGIVDAKIWDINNNIQSFEEGNFIKIDASAQIFNNEIQLNIKRLRKSTEGEYDPTDYIPATSKDINSLYDKLIGYIGTIKTEPLQTLLKHILIDNPDINGELKKHSAAKHMHHSYMGGLLEHTLSVVEICDFMAPRYRNVNRDLLVTAAMLHDICKIFELSPFPENDYTDEGQLLGHIYLCAEMISREAAKIEGFPPTLARLLKHCILSHHGEYEYGSPKKPKTIEAFILHCADDTDAKINIFESYLDTNNTRGEWVGYHKLLARNIRTSDYE